MKNIWKIALLVAALMTSCNQPDIEDGFTPDQNGTNTNAIEFYAGDANRTTYFEDEGLGIHWEAGDEVAIIARTYYDKAGVPSEDRLRGKYTATTTGESTQFAHAGGNYLLAWDLAFSNAAGTIVENNVDFYAFHSGNKYSSSTTIYRGISVYSSPDQKQSVAGDYSHIGDYTVLASNKVTRLAGDTEPVAFNFTNCMSIVELTLKGESTRSVKQVTLTSTEAPLAFTEAFLCVDDFVETTDVVEKPYTIYPENGAGTEGILSKSVTVTLDDYTALSADGIKLYFVVMPGSHNAGAIKLTTRDQNNNFAEVEMGAVTFEKNQIYRPAVSLEFTNVAYATIKHEFSEYYSLPVPFVEGCKPIIERYSYPLQNIPASLVGFDIAAYLPSKHPTTNKIVAMTDGYAYLLVGSSGNNAGTNAEKARVFFEENGWEAVTEIPTEKVTEAPAASSTLIYYPSGSEYGAMVLYSRYMTAGEEFDLTQYTAVVKNFQGIRPVAKEIINESNKLTLYFNFSDNAQGWTVYDSFSKVLANAYQGEKPYLFPGGQSYDLDFSYSANGGSGLHKDNYLLMYLRTSTAESIGLPAIEGYKLVTVAGTELKASVTPTVGVSSVAAPTAPVYVSDTYTLTGSNTTDTWTLTLQEPQANTKYYFYATDNVSGSQDMRLQYMTLIYEKAE